MYPKNSRFLSVNVNDKASGIALDRILDGGDETISINGVDVKASSIRIHDIKFGGVFALIIFSVGDEVTGDNNDTSNKVKELQSIIDGQEDKFNTILAERDEAKEEFQKCIELIAKLKDEIKELKSTTNDSVEESNDNA